MRVVLIVGRVLDPQGFVVKAKAGRIFVNQETYLMQPADRCALEAALRIKDGTEAEVVVLPRRVLEDDDVLRRALAVGGDRAVALTGEQFAEADDGAMAGVLAAAVGRLEPVDLLLTGATTLDTGQGQLGVRLAEALGWPQIVGGWDVGIVDQNVEVVCRGEGGYVTCRVGLPAVVTVVPGALKLRYADGMRLINVYRDEGVVERWDVDDLVGEDAPAALLENRGREFPPERERGDRAAGNVTEMAQAAADALRQWVR